MDLRSDTLVQCLRAQRELMGLTVAQIAERSGMPESTVTKVLNGTVRTPSYETVAPIAKALGVSLDSLEADKPDMTYSPPDMADAAGMPYAEHISRIVGIYEKRLKEKTRWLNILAIVLAVLVGALLFFLMYDITHPTLGWVQYGVR